LTAAAEEEEEEEEEKEEEAEGKKDGRGIYTPTPFEVAEKSRLKQQGLPAAAPSVEKNRAPKQPPRRGGSSSGSSGSSSSARRKVQGEKRPPRRGNGAKNPVSRKGSVMKV
jgi:hypothetical protein